MEWECLKGLGIDRREKIPKIKKKRKVNIFLGSYPQYLKSKLWKSRKRRYWRYYKKICFCCNSRATDLHHCTYKNIYNERNKDLIPLCKKCHIAITDMVFLKEAKLKEAHIIYKKILSLSIE